jgi:hypothetical protein
LRRLLWIHHDCTSAIRHRLVRVRYERHDRHASGKGESKRENSCYLFHGRVPFSPASVILSEPVRNSVTAVTFWRFSVMLREAGTWARDNCACQKRRPAFSGPKLGK